MRTEFCPWWIMLFNTIVPFRRCLKVYLSNRPLVVFAVLLDRKYVRLTLQYIGTSQIVSITEIWIPLGEAVTQTFRGFWLVHKGHR